MHTVRPYGRNDECRGRPVCRPDKGDIMENKLPKRKNIWLKHYDYSQPGYYFVTICTYGKKNLFGKIVGASLVSPYKN